MLVQDRIKPQDAMLIADVVDKHGCENLISVNISILCPYICAYPFLLT